MGTYSSNVTAAMGALAIGNARGNNNGIVPFQPYQQQIVPVQQPQQQLANGNAGYGNAENQAMDWYAIMSQFPNPTAAQLKKVQFCMRGSACKPQHEY